MSLAWTTCNSEPVFWASSIDALAANFASSEPSVASKIFVGKMLISFSFRAWLLELVSRDHTARPLTVV
jgi:hypothetical protein